MSDSLKKLNELRLKNEGVFGNLFGKKEEDEDQSIVTPFGVDSVKIGKNPIKELPSNTIRSIQEYDWQDGSLSWVLNSSWAADMAWFNFEKETLAKFGGIWKQGHFRGGQFVYTANSAFHPGGGKGDTSFYGEYRAPFHTWLAHPTQFAGGTVVDGKNGLLGMANIDKLVVDRTGGTGEKVFNMLRIPPGKTIKFVTIDDQEYIVKVLKRLDENDSEFIWQVVSSNGSEEVISKKWSELVAGYRSLNIDINDVRTVPSWLGINAPNGLKSIEVGETAMQTKPKEEKVEAEFEMPLSALSLAGGNAVAKIIGADTINIALTRSNFEAYNRVKKDIESGQLGSDLMDIRKGISDGIINGFSDFPMFREMFGNQKGTDVAKTKERYKHYYFAMARVNDFIETIVRNIATAPTGGQSLPEPHTAAIEAFNDQLKEILQVENLKKFPVRGATPAVGGGTAPAPSKMRPLNIPKPGPANEAIRKEIRDILDNNF